MRGVGFEMGVVPGKQRISRYIRGTTFPRLSHLWHNTAMFVCRLGVAYRSHLDTQHSKQHELTLPALKLADLAKYPAMSIRLTLQSR